MASLPVTLTYGMISVYGEGSIWGIRNQQENAIIQFGRVDQVYSGEATLAVGDSVMYRSDDVTAPVQYVYGRYWILPVSKIIAIEDPLS